MEERKSPEYTLELLADRSCVKEIVKAILHTIFFHRYFTALTPTTHDLFDITLPVVSDVELETLIDQRATTLSRHFEISPYSNPNASDQQGGRGQVVVQFMEKKRRKGWFGGKADDELVWESWVLDVTLATPRTDTEVVKARRAMENSLQRTALKIINIVNRDRNHIPPITTNETNPFPYQILVNPKNEGWGRGMGIF
ncbi:DUF1649-domain-containing protein [Myriangium duriaei CBS 260.36]|uniref:Autophagy-related protein 101 n=1 Tax=Myriangium duriaei CBS 260.36 TaxID=1168546 RepID=A0A9P4MQC9_9PEZI|nr:DUF1649-domain-containing protein [Myriangium duriaei CBS 260.36]